MLKPLFPLENQITLPASKSRRAGLTSSHTVMLHWKLFSTRYSLCQVFSFAQVSQNSELYRHTTVMEPSERNILKCLERGTEGWH